MVVDGCPPNVVTFNTLIKGLCANGRVEGAMSVLHQMEKYECLPNIRTYNELLDGLFRVNRFREACGIIKDIEERNVDLNIVAYNIIMHGFSSVGMQERVFQILEKILVNGVKPDAITVNVIIHAYSTEEVIVYLHNKMLSKGIFSNVSTWDVLIRAVLYICKFFTCRLGGTPLMELMIAAGKSVLSLQLQHGLAVVRVYTGTFMTSLDMAGAHHTKIPIPVPLSTSAESEEVVGAVVIAGLPLARVATEAKHATELVRTMGVGLTVCTFLGQVTSDFVDSGKIELGLAGAAVADLQLVNVVVSYVLNQILSKLQRRPLSFPVYYNRRRMRAAVTGKKDLQRAEGSHRRGLKLLSAASFVWSSELRAFVVGVVCSSGRRKRLCQCHRASFLPP
ncbi:hypothetical protein AHAS_Ahas15G0303000 [Arachis hypogaea]